MTDIKEAKERLITGGYTCVICRGGDVRAFSLRGVRPLVTLVESGERFCGYSAADKVVGKATAFLYVILGVKSVYAQVISQPALRVLTAYGIVAEYDTLVTHIINRQGNGVCPFEEAVGDVEEPETAYAEILSKMRRMNISI